MVAHGDCNDSNKFFHMGDDNEMNDVDSGDIGKLNILILYEPYSTHTGTVKEHLESFIKYSRHQVCYAVGSRGVKCGYDLNIFDVVILHYSLRFTMSSGEHMLSPSYQKKLVAYSGYKIIFAQDEYENTNTLKQWIKVLGVNAVFTCVPEQQVDKVYPEHEFPSVKFISNLTGYAPEPGLYDSYVKSLAKRDVLIGYRGRQLPYHYGNLARGKFLIGQRMHEICKRRCLPVDIEVEEGKRIYGEDWYHFLANARATLGTESGSNVFDFTGDIMKNVMQKLKVRPDSDYQEIFDQFIAEHDGKVMMNQVSPKIFESISLRTALVLFEGGYSGVVKPNLHYIPLKEDFSNVDEVLVRLQDDEFVTAMTERAYEDVIVSGKFSYCSFIRGVDDFLNQQVRAGRAVEFVTVNIAYRHQDLSKNSQINMGVLATSLSPQVFNFADDLYAQPFPSMKKVLQPRGKKILMHCFFRVIRPAQARKFLCWLDKRFSLVAVLIRFAHRKLMRF